MNSIKRSITMPILLDRFVIRCAKNKAKARGRKGFNYSEVLAELVIEAKNKLSQIPGGKSVMTSPIQLKEAA